MSYLEDSSTCYLNNERLLKFKKSSLVIPYKYGQHYYANSNIFKEKSRAWKIMQSNRKQIRSLFVPFACKMTVALTTEYIYISM